MSMPKIKNRDSEKKKKKTFDQAKAEVAMNHSRTVDVG